MAERSNDSFGEFLDGESLQIQRFLPGPIERVWMYLTDSELRSSWLAAGDMKGEPGSEFEFVWRNDELDGNPKSAAAEVDSKCAVEEHRMQSQIVTWEPPHRLEFTWSDSGGVAIELETRGEEVLLTLTHRRLPHNSGIIVGASAGWHAHLDYLIARLAETAPKPFWTNYARLKAAYEERVPE